MKKIIGKKYSYVFTKETPSPTEYRTIHAKYMRALKRLWVNSYKTEQLKSNDEVFVHKILSDIKNIEYRSKIILNKQDVIISAP